EEILRADAQEYEVQHGRTTPESEPARVADRYTLQDAAKTLEREAGGQYDRWIFKLKRAAEHHELPTYAPGEYDPLVYAPGQSQCVRDFHDEVYPDDLNRWLEST